MNKQEVAVNTAQKQITGQKLVWEAGWGFRGLDVKAIQQASGLNYSQQYLAVLGAFMPKAEKLVVLTSDGAPKPEPVLAAMVRDARLAGQSWGYIMVRTGFTLGQCHKLFKAATGLEAAGQRIGRGGRFVGDAGVLYTGADRKVLGCEIKAGQKAKAKPTTKRTFKPAVHTKATEPVKAS